MFLSPVVVSPAVKMAIAAASTEMLRSTEASHRLAIDTVTHMVHYAMSSEYNLPISKADFVRCMGHAISIGDNIGGRFLEWYSDIIEWCLR